MINRNDTSPWWADVTRYQWMVLAIASAGWVFDVFEGQIFGACMNEALPELLRHSSFKDSQELIVNIGLGSFLAGGALGGIIFGMMADRWGRRWTMAATILMYSIFTGLTFFAQTWWQLVALRFLVGLGVGGEWAVAAAVVAEVFPARARPAASGIFHASSVLGTYLAVLAGIFVVNADGLRQSGVGWRYGFLLGVLPALLILWIRMSMREPESWENARKQGAAAPRLGRLTDLFRDPALLRRTLIGTGLAAVGLATFWGCHFRGKDVLRQAQAADERTHLILPLAAASAVGAGSVAFASSPLSVLAQQTPSYRVVLTNALAGQRLKNIEMLGMFLVTTGGGAGLLSFAPISQRFGRRGAFLMFHLAALASVVLVFLVAGSALALLLVLPVFGYFTLAMHAGYAIYFPELYPTRLRGTGAGFCFNVARIVVVPVLLAFAWLQMPPLQLTLQGSMLVLAMLFLVGALLLLWAPETRGKPLPE